MQFELLTSSEKINCSEWLDNYIERRYGKYSETLRKVWGILLETCYKDSGYHENEVGSALAARPQFMPVRTGPCCYAKLYYDADLFEKAVRLFASAAEEFGKADGYQYDLCDLVRQALSNRFNTNQKKFAKAYENRDISAVKEISETQLALLKDLDLLLSHRSEFCLSRWIGDSHRLAADDTERKYFDLNARTLITLWGDMNDTNILHDYAWREWSGLVGEFYFTRWQMFYNDSIAALEQGVEFKVHCTEDFAGRAKYIESLFGRSIFDFEKQWVHTYKEYPYPEDSDVTETANNLIDIWKIGK